MGLFTQSIVIKPADPNYVIEKITLPPLKKSKIDISVPVGYTAIVGKQVFKGSSVPHQTIRDLLGPAKEEPAAYIYAEKEYDALTVPFFGGQHVVCLSALPACRAKFAIVGQVTIELSDYKALADHFGRSITREEMMEEVVAAAKQHLSNEVQSAASAHIKPDTTEVTLRAALKEISEEAIQGQTTRSILTKMGFALSRRGISMRLNSLEDADQMLDEATKALMHKAIESLNDDLLDRQERERDREREHEIDAIRAGRTTIAESTTTITTNGTGRVTIASGEKAPAPNKRFCTNCGAEVPATARFCGNCGKPVQ